MSIPVGERAEKSTDPRVAAAFRVRPDAIGCQYDVANPDAIHACACPTCDETQWTPELRLARMQKLLDRIAPDIVVAENGCWHYRPEVQTSNGYRAYAITDPTRKQGQRKPGVHRLVFVLTTGDAVDLHVDHACHTAACPGGPTCAHRMCANPAHLRAVTNRVNSQNRTVRPVAEDGPAHGTTTRAGKPYNCKCDDCRAARNAYQREYQKKNRAQKNESQRRWREKNLEKHRAYQREYQRTYKARQKRQDGAA